MVLSIWESRGILGNGQLTEKFWSFEQGIDIFSHLRGTLGTSQEPAAVLGVCVTLGSGGAPGGAGKSPAANEALMEGAAPGVGSRSHGHFPCDVCAQQEGKKLETKDKRRNVPCAAPLSLPSLELLGDTTPAPWIPGSHHPEGSAFLPLRAKGCLGTFLPLLGLAQVDQEEKISPEKPVLEVCAELGGRFCLADWFLLSSRMFSPLWKTHSLGWSWWKEELGRHWGQHVLSSWRKTAGMCNP